MLWLILCVNLTSLRDAQLAGKTLFLDVSVRVFLEEISVWLTRLRRDLPSPMWVVIIQSVGSPSGTKRQRKGRFSLLELGCLSSALTQWCSLFSGIWNQAELYHQLSCFSSLQTASSVWDFLASIAMWANSCHKTPLISIYILLVPFLWRTLTNTLFIQRRDERSG